MEECGLCGSENPSEARFCMKCGGDLPARSSGASPTNDSDPGTFTPAATSEHARLGPTAAIRRRRTSDPSEIEAYKKQAASESSGAFESQIQYIDPSEPSEIKLSAVTADFNERHNFCNKCGASNSYEQRFCLQCGNTLSRQIPNQADLNFDPAPAIPLAPLTEEPFGRVALADLHSAPASDYFGEPAGAGKRGRRSAPFASAVANHGPGQWLLIAATLLLAAALIWLLALGGFKMLFNAKVRRINKAASAMERLSSFQYTVSAAVESADGVQYGGGGRAIHESPDKSLWEMTLVVPGKPVATATMEVKDKIYINGPSWQSSTSDNARADVSDLWKDFQSVEDLGNQPIGALNCRHYRYRIPPNLITTVLGVGSQSAASDAVVEAWIDTTSAQVIKMTVQVYNVQIEGASATVLLAMDLAEVGQPYNINAPQPAPAQQPATSSTPQ